MTAADTHILKPLGDLVTKFTGYARCQEHIHFANVRVYVNFQPITGSYEVYSIYTFTKLPNGKKTIHNANGNTVVVNTFLGNDDIRTYTKPIYKITLWTSRARSYLLILWAPSLA